MSPRPTSSTSRRLLLLAVLAVAAQAAVGLGVLASAHDEEQPATAAPREPREVAVAGSVERSDDLVDLELKAGVPLPPPEVPDAVYLEGRTRTPPSESERRFAELFPDQASAVQHDRDPATFHWAVIVGVNDYAAPTGDTFGSVADALVLRDVLLARGWREDHILLLTDQMADRERTVLALEWLARSTDERSTVVVSSSGHIRHKGGRTGLWPADNDFLWSEDLGGLLGAIRADRMWISFQGCHAGGLAAPGVEGPDRIVTYSSPVTQKSFEDPETGHSLQGFYMFAEGFREGWGDADGDGRVSIQEAHAWGAPRAESRSAALQIPVMVDGTGGVPFHLEVEGATAPADAYGDDPSA